MQPATPNEVQRDPGTPEAPAMDQGYPVVIGGAVALAALLAIGVAFRSRRAAPAGSGALTAGASPDEVPTVVDAADPPEQAATALDRFRVALQRSRSALQHGLDRFLGKPDDEAALDVLEEALLRADVGVRTTGQLVDRVRAAAQAAGADPEVLRGVLREQMLQLVRGVRTPLADAGSPLVILVVGVNGSGKTTTIGKLANRYTAAGRKVMLAAADTYRAGAAEQLAVWAERAGADLVRGDEGADPSSVVYKALEGAQRDGHDVVLVDTAGRLQTRRPLMEQLAKMRRVIDKHVPGAPHETLLVLDGTMGQNGMSQAQLFHAATPLTGVVVTKLDGSARGGMVLAISTELSLPVKLVGLGEQADDLRDFDPAAFVDALL